jgi:hypothetical protein
VVDAHATSPEATAELWRFLFGIDLVERIKSGLVDPAWPLLHLVRDPRRLKISVSDGLWLRLVDLEAALRARTFAEGEPAVVEVTDAVRAGNAGPWSVGPEPGRTSASQLRAARQSCGREVSLVRRRSSPRRCHRSVPRASEKPVVFVDSARRSQDYEGDGGWRIAYGPAARSTSSPAR